VDRAAAALVLDEVAALLALEEAEPFRVGAYRTAAGALDHLDQPLESALASGALADLPGIGRGMIGVLTELVETGRSRLHDRLREETPSGVVSLRTVPGLGPKRVRTVREELGIETLDELREAAEAGRIAALRGFGPATQKRILDGIPFVDASVGRRRQPQGQATADRVIRFLEGLGALEVVGLRSVRLAGELRRGCETVDGIDVLAVAESPTELVEAFGSLPLGPPERIDDERTRVRLADGAWLRLRCVPPDEAAVAWAYETGAVAHVAGLRDRADELGLRLDAAALWRGDERIPLEDEAALYAALELEWVPPELREGRGEVAAAVEGRLPRLVEYDDLRGTFHCHTTWSDGRGTVAEMAEGALARGWRYLGIADHSPSAGYAGGLSVDALRRQQREIDAWNRSRGGELRLLKGVESDILRDGSLDYPDDVLAGCDYVLGSVHSGFRMDGAAMTRRIAAAVENPWLDILGHPTGRLLLTREPYAVDLGAVVDAAAGAGTAIEINGDPHRLDMDWRYWPRAKTRDVRCAVNPDAHSVADLGAVVYGVRMARKGGLEPEDVVNCWELERVNAWLGAA
jgi:DNA polymerase (family 10)